MTKKETPPDDHPARVWSVQGQSTESIYDINTRREKKAMSEETKFIEEPATVSEHWVCDSDGKAKWVCEQIKKIKDNFDYMLAWYAEQVKKAKETAEFECAKWESYLAAYFDTVPHRKAGKSESYSFPGGKLIRKRQDPEFKRDEQTVIAFLKEQNAPQFVKVKETLDWDNLKKSCAGFAEGKVVFCEQVTEDGEIVPVFVPGIEVVERADKFVVEVK